MAAVVQLHFVAAHARVEQRHADGATVVGHEDENGIVAQTFLVEQRGEPTHVLVDIGHHAEEEGDRQRLVGIGLAVLRGHQQRNVGRVERKVGEEGLAGGLAIGDPVHGLVEEDVGAIALGLANLAILVPQPGVGISVPPVLGGRGDVRRRKPQRLLEPAILGTIRIAVTQMPFAELPGAITGGGKQVGHGGQAPAQERAAAGDVHRSVAQGVEAAENFAAGWGAHRRDVKIGQPDALRVELVDVGSFEHRVAEAGKVAIARVIDEHQDHVGASRPRHCFGRQEQRQRQDRIPPVHARPFG